MSISKAMSVAGCLTNDEARKIWPREHLYWHTGAHCWDASSPAEYKAKLHGKLGPDSSAFGLAEAMQYSLYISRLAEFSPYLWIDAIGWWPNAAPTFESKWNDSLFELGRMTPGSKTEVFTVAMNPPDRRASLSTRAE